jgi:hypothetical protein
MSSKTQIDVQVENHGSVFTFAVLTEAARAWVDENVQLESWQWMGGCAAFAVDARFAWDLACGM